MNPYYLYLHARRRAAYRRVRYGDPGFQFPWRALAAGAAAAAPFYRTGKKIYSKYRKSMLGYFRSRPHRRRRKGIPRIMKRLNRLERGYGKELKTHDISYSATVTNSAVIGMLTNIAQGDTSITREGLKIDPKYLSIKAFFNTDASATVTSFVRLIIFQDREQHGTVPAVTELLESSDYASFYEHDTKPRFKILLDKVVSPALVAAGRDRTAIYKSIKFGKYAKIHYSGTTNLQASQGKNNIYYCTISSSTANHPYLTLRTRFRFTD